MGNPMVSDGTVDERPVHQVTLDGYWIDRTEVSNGQYRRCVDDSACDVPRYWDEPVFRRFRADNLPVVGVDWDDALAYCTWAGARLPTEAEWEYAAAGPEAHRYPWGNDEPTCDRAQWAMCGGEALPVGSLPAGASWVGALDLAGNVWEWVADWYRLYSPDPQTNPTGPETGYERVMRGGVWSSMPFQITATSRFYWWPDARSIKIGFRCAY